MVWIQVKLVCTDHRTRSTEPRPAIPLMGATAPEGRWVASRAGAAPFFPFLAGAAAAVAAAAAAAVAAALAFLAGGASVAAAAWDLES